MINISGAKFKEHCFNTATDILDFDFSFFIQFTNNQAESAKCFSFSPKGISKIKVLNNI